MKRIEVTENHKSMEFIDKHMDGEWAVYLFSLKINDFCVTYADYEPDDLSEILEFADIPFTFPLGDYLNIGFLPSGVKENLDIINELLSEVYQVGINALILPYKDFLKAKVLTNLNGSARIMDHFHAMVDDILNYIAARSEKPLTEDEMNSALDLILENGFDALPDHIKKRLKRFQE